VLIVGQGFSQVREPLATLLVFLAVLLPLFFVGFSAARCGGPSVKEV
jgi:hypothetical protein